MREITLSYGADFDWIYPFVKQLEGTVVGNFILLPESINTGTRYFIDCGDDVFALYVDVTYHTDVHFIQKNTSTDFLCLYYDLTEGEAFKEGSNFVYNLGVLGYNMFVIDSSLSLDYYIKKGSCSFMLCLFIKKSKLNLYASKNIAFLDNLDKIKDTEQNTFIKFERMPSDSYHFLKDLRKLNIGGDVFNLELIGTVHVLLSEYINQMINDVIIMEKVDESDLGFIVKTQHFLSEHCDGVFPSIASLASMANMSETKFKNLFKKITGITPNVFFMNNKLIMAKELIEEKRSSMADVSDQFHFSNYSYFTAKFKDYFGLTPRDFIKKM